MTKKNTGTDIPIAYDRRLIGRVLQKRPEGPGIICVPGHQPSRFVFSTSLVADVEKHCLVTFVPNPPERGKRGVATEVRVCLSATDAPPPPRADK